MALKTPTTPAGGNSVKQAAIEPDTYPARILQVVDLGVQAQPKFGNDKPKPPVQMIRVVYELVDCFCLDEAGLEDEERPRIIGEKFPLHSINSDLARSTKRIKAIDPKNKAGGDWSKMVGAPCSVMVANYPKKDGSGTGYKVGDVSSVMRGYTPPELKGNAGFFDLDDPNMELFEEFPDFLKDDIKANLNFKGSKLEAMLAGKEPEEEPKKEDPVEEETPPFEADEPVEDGEEDTEGDPWS